MSYFKKIKAFSWPERFAIIKYSIGSILIDKTPKGLKNTYLFTRNLIGSGIEVTKSSRNIYFEYPIDHSVFTFELNRNSSDASVFEQIVLEEEYLNVVNIIRDYGLPFRTMIDAGANIGLTSIYFKAKFPEVKIVALEPSVNTFERLNNHIKINNLKGIDTVNKGLWHSSVKLKADRSFRDAQDWSFRMVEAKDNEETLFEAISMDDLISGYSIDTVDFLKIDIEGGEVPVFLEAKDLRWLDKINIIALEIHDEFNCRESIESILKETFELSHSGELTIGINRNLIKPQNS